MSSWTHIIKAIGPSSDWFDDRHKLVGKRCRIVSDSKPDRLQETVHDQYYLAVEGVTSRSAFRDVLIAPIAMSIEEARAAGWEDEE